MQEKNVFEAHKKESRKYSKLADLKISIVKMFKNVTCVWHLHGPDIKEKIYTVK